LLAFLHSDNEEVKYEEFCKALSGGNKGLEPDMVLEISERICTDGIWAVLPNPPHSPSLARALVHLFDAIASTTNVMTNDERPVFGNAVRMIANDRACWEVMMTDFGVSCNPAYGAFGDLVAHLNKESWSDLVELGLLPWLMRPLKTRRVHDLSVAFATISLLFGGRNAWRAIEALGDLGLFSEIKRLWKDYSRGGGKMVVCDHDLKMRSNSIKFMKLDPDARQKLSEWFVASVEKASSVDMAIFRSMEVCCTARLFTQKTNSKNYCGKINVHKNALEETSNVKKHGV